MSQEMMFVYFGTFLVLFNLMVFLLHVDVLVTIFSAITVLQVEGHIPQSTAHSPQPTNGLCAKGQRPKAK